MPQVSIARHHLDWLRLVEPSGPFLSMPVLLRVFPQGLDAHDPAHMRDLRAAYEEWRENQTGSRPDPAIHTAWLRFVLEKTLELPTGAIAEGQAIPQTLQASVPEHGETLRPDLVVRNPAGRAGAGAARLLIARYPVGQDLDKPIPGKHWKASPATRMMELLHATDVRLGLVTNGERWTLVDAPRGETTGYASWYASLWQEEHVTLQAFRSLFSGRRFFGVPDGETLEAMLAESAQNQEEVTDQLGYQVRRAVEVLIQELDRSDQDHGGALLSGTPETVLYEAALTVMMRLVFLFCAEERGLLLLGDPVYDQFYAVSTLRESLRDAADQHGEEVLERRRDAWCRILSTFRAVFGGVRHERMRLLAYGGSLFDPDRFPFLEGRLPGTSWRDTPSDPLPVDNRTVLHLLESLQMLEVKVPGGGRPEARRLSFRALDIEQIGHVYEGLLDHTAKRATEPMLSLTGAKDREPEVALSRLEELAPGEGDGLLTFLVKETGRSANALTNALAAPVEGDAAAAFRAACGNDDALLARVLPFSGLVRRDTFGKPVVIPPGSVFVTTGTDRRSSGTHYTPRSLTEPIVQYTLEPLVYEGPAEGKPKEEWRLRSAGELLDLNVCDMACGSGAFLVQTARYLSECLQEAWQRSEEQNPGCVAITPEGAPSQGRPEEAVVPHEPAERSLYALRIVAQRCLYGVDKNPLAVEMAKLSLWLLTVAKDRPFTFLDHAIRHGDSLLGIRDLKQLRAFSLDGDTENSTLTNAPHMAYLDRLVKQAAELREEIARTPSTSADETRSLRLLLDSSEKLMGGIAASADALIAAELGEGASVRREDRLAAASVRVATFLQRDDIAGLRDDTAERLAGRSTFHWPLEFPEVFGERRGLDAFVCNPPFMGGKRICWSLGDAYRDHLKRVWSHARGAADLCTFFFLRAAELLRRPGAMGYLATNSIAQGDTREVGLEHLVASGLAVANAVPDAPWPGTAGVSVARLVLHTEPWLGERLLDGRGVRFISPHLEAVGQTGTPLQVRIPTPRASYGTALLGIGFTVEVEAAETWIAQDSRYVEVLSPYINASDLNSAPDMAATRWVIDFGDLPEEQAERYPLAMQRVRDLVKPQRDRLDRQIHEPCYWKHWDKRRELYDAIRGRHDVLVAPLVTKHLSFAFLPTGWTYSKELGVLPTDRRDLFALYQATYHEIWARRNSSTLETRLAYSFSDALRTYPVPSHTLTMSDARVADVGERYHEHRRQLMLDRWEGLTKTYNRFHNPEETAADIVRLRELHVEMDNAVAAAYGWSDLDLGHGFHETKQGVRYTLCEEARAEVLDRLLALNHERYAEEVAQGLHEKRRARRRGPGSAGAPAGSAAEGRECLEPEPAGPSRGPGRRARRRSNTEPDAAPDLGFELDLLDDAEVEG